MAQNAITKKQSKLKANQYHTEHYITLISFLFIVTIYFHIGTPSNHILSS